MVLYLPSQDAAAAAPAVPLLAAAELMALLVLLASSSMYLVPCTTPQAGPAPPAGASTSTVHTSSESAGPALQATRPLCTQCTCTSSRLVARLVVSKEGKASRGAELLRPAAALLLVAAAARCKQLKLRGMHLSVDGA